MLPSSPHAPNSPDAPTSSSDPGLSAEACRRRREALQISLDELARRARLNPRTVERFEAASVRPRPVTVVALRNALRRSEQAVAEAGAVAGGPGAGGRPAA